MLCDIDLRYKKIDPIVITFNMIGLFFLGPWCLNLAYNYSKRRNIYREI